MSLPVVSLFAVQFYSVWLNYSSDNSKYFVQKSALGTVSYDLKPTRNELASAKLYPRSVV